MKQVRRVPLDIPAIQRESGLHAGKICRSTAAQCWCVMAEDSGGVICAEITPPPMLPGESVLVINGKDWCFS